MLKKGDFVIYSEHIIEIVAKAALLYQKALNRVLPVHIEAQYVHCFWFSVILALDVYNNQIIMFLIFCNTMVLLIK